MHAVRKRKKGGHFRKILCSGTTQDQHRVLDKSVAHLAPGSRSRIAVAEGTVGLARLLASVTQHCCDPALR